MTALTDVVRDMLDGRENDEQVTVEVSLLWSLVYEAEAVQKVAEAEFYRYQRMVSEMKAALLDPGRLARVIQRAFYIGWCAQSWNDVDEWKKDLNESFEWYASANQMAEAIAKAYSEEEGMNE